MSVSQGISKESSTRSIFEPIGNRQFLLDPIPKLARMRREAPVYRQPGTLIPIVNVFRYDDTVDVLRNCELFRNPLPERYSASAFTDQHNLLGMDPPEHTRQRDVVRNIFTPKMIIKLESKIRRNCEEIVAAVLERDEFDAVDEFAAKLTVFMICQLTGVPDSDHGLIRRWTNKATDLGFDALWATEPMPERQHELSALMDEMHDYFGARINERVKQQQGDIFSELAHSGLSRQECISFARLLIIAGNETTTNLINNSLRLLIDNPDKEAMLRKDQSLIPKAIEEILRFWPSIRVTFRTANADCEIRGEKIFKDDLVWAWLMSANRDAALCRNPDTLDFSRPKTRHVSFGHGIHVCLGNALARLEARIMLETVFNRTSKIVRTRTDGMEPVNTIVSNGLRQQLVAFS
ncbi:MAG: cytochrome P450 [Woeseiaceae bacterium]|nr:cytochrome P450 [Woeseiaceae bacterium]